MKKSLIALALLTGFASVNLINTVDFNKASASEELSISNSGDAFTLLDKSFTAEESFVYTADLHFKSGQAGGIAFGSKENEYYYVLNMDRYEDRVKLLYFSSNGSGYSAKELENDYFIGNDKITSYELDMVKPRVANIDKVNLKVILTVEDTHTYVEFYVEGIKRFGVDRTIDLNAYSDIPSYQGGYLGMNCFNSDVYLENIEIGKSDYSYFSELYRNQYHLQPFSRWTNDPNALCYYNGYYHVFYQTNPFGQLWSDMYWGHARSRDLIHFEFLPICLFPEKAGMGFGDGDAFMWSGCAIAYTKGMSLEIDNENWFPNGNGNGIVAIYTRDGARQDQIMISSDDEGLTWTKRRLVVSQSLTGISDHKVGYRDPKVFPLYKDYDGKVLLWGMTLSSYELNRGWFLKSTNLVDWGNAGSFALPTPECIGVGVLKDEHGNEKAYLSNKSRTYILGDMSYNGSTGNVEFIDESGTNISNYTLEEMNERLKPLDFGPDTYASQSFYIDDDTSEYNGKEIVLNWFSGDLNASFCTGPGEYASLRSRWNGGFTMPVEYSLASTSEGYRIKQTPISVNNANLLKEEVINISDTAINEDSENVLKDVDTHIFELSASITNNNEGDITFLVDVGENEYMEFGWNKTDGYYVDRTYLDDKGINTNVDWHAKYASHILGDSNVKTFYVLSDNGGLEVFCEDYSISFYFVTTASVNSRGAILQADDATINNLVINEVASIYRQDVDPEEGVLIVANEEVELDTYLNKNEFVTCYFSGNTDIAYEISEGEDIIDIEGSNDGVNIIATQAGEATIKISVKDKIKYIHVTVYDSSFTSDFSFRKDNIVSGKWMMKDAALVGEKDSGNAFILTEEGGNDFTLSGSFNIISGTAAALVFRASADMSKYLVANYDSNEKVVKLWSTNGELARSEVMDVALSNITLTIEAEGRNIRIFLNGEAAITHTLADNEPLEGKFGLNVFSARAEFLSLSVLRDDYDYSSGDLSIKLEGSQFVYEIYNVTLGNIRLEPGFYYQNNGVLYITSSYFDLLNENGVYSFRIIGSNYSFVIKVNVDKTPSTPVIDDINVEEGLDVNVYIGNIELTTLNINDNDIEESQYYVKDYTLHISKECFELGENDVVINDDISFTVTVNKSSGEIHYKEKVTDYTPLVIILSISGGLLLAGGLVSTLLIIKKKKGK